jgi:hypothetical protein
MHCGKQSDCDPIGAVDGGALACPPEDLVCCNGGCDDNCKSCLLPGKVGYCNLVPEGTDPEDDCPAPQVCNGATACTAP